MSRPVLRDSAASTLGVLLQGGARFAVSVLVGRIAGPGALAVVNGSLSLATVASLLWPTSTGQAASIILAREEAAGRAHVVPAVERHLARRTGIAVALTLPIVVVLAIVLVGVNLHTALWAGALTAAFSAYNVARGVQFGRGQVVRATRWEALSAMVTLGVLAGVLYADLPELYLMPLTLGYGMYALGGWRASRDGIRELPEGLRRELDRYVAWGVVGTLASTGLIHLSMVMAVTMEGARDAGMYAAAISLATPAAMLATAFSMALAPTMARAVGRAQTTELSTQTDGSTRALVTGMVLVFGVIAIFAPPLVALLYGADFADAVVLVRILLVAVLLSTLPVAAVNSITVRGARGVQTAAGMAVVSLVAGLVAMAALAVEFGVVGVAAGFLVGALVKAVLPLGWVWRRNRHSWAGLALRASAGVAAMCGIAFLEPLDLAHRLLYATVFVAAWVALSTGEYVRHRRLLT